MVGLEDPAIGHRVGLLAIAGSDVEVDYGRLEEHKVCGIGRREVVDSIGARLSCVGDEWIQAVSRLQRRTDCYCCFKSSR